MTTHAAHTRPKKAKKGALREIGEHRAAFALAFVCIFAVTFGFLSLVGATPDTLQNTDASALATNTDTGQTNATNTAINNLNATGNQTNQTTQAGGQTGVVGQGAQQTGELPARITAKAIGLNVTISNPASSAIDVLDHALLSGAVRYPTSATLGVDGTVLLFGHSSYLPIVHNQAYKAFDGIQNFKTGDTISVYSGAHEYRYSVVGVKLADANNDVIELPAVGKHLTLVTCDSFASKSNRFVVTADFVGVYAAK